MKVSVNDCRIEYKPTFEEIKVGEMFTEPDNDYIYIKMLPCYCEENETTFNAMCLDGDTTWFENNEVIDPVREISIIIK